MAAYGREDFVYGSDLSDLSDFSEDELNVNDLSDISNDSEDDGRQYCVCNEASTSEMIACDDDQCAVVWWHYDCAGLSKETIPEYSWICNRCRPSCSTKNSGIVSHIRGLLLKVFFVFHLRERGLLFFHFHSCIMIL